MKTEESLHVVDTTDAKAGEEPKEAKKPKRNANFNTSASYTDEQTVNIAQNLALDLSREAFESLDFSRASAVTAMTGVLALVAGTAQANIKAKQDKENAGEIAGAAGMVAALFSKVVSDASEGTRPLISDLQENHPGKSLADVGDDSDVELTPGESYIGLEDVRLPEAGVDEEDANPASDCFDD